MGASPISFRSSTAGGFCRMARWLQRQVAFGDDGVRHHVARPAEGPEDRQVHRADHCGRSADLRHGAHHPTGRHLCQPRAEVRAKSMLLYYREEKDGRMLEGGITEAGSMGSFMAAGTAYM